MTSFARSVGPAGGALLLSMALPGLLTGCHEELSLPERIAAATADARIIGLGENGHGMAEYFTFKTELVRHFYEHEAVDLLLVEGGIGGCLSVADESRTTEQHLGDCFYDSWGYEQALPLFELVRSTRESDRPLRVVGFDNFPTSEYFATVLEDLGAGPVRAGELEAAYRDLFQGIGGSSSEDDLARQRAMIAEYRAILDTLAGAEDPYRKVAAIAVEARIMSLQPARLGSREAMEQGRDEVMGWALTRLATEVFPGRRMLVWGHNAHLAKAHSQPPNSGFRRSGEWLAEAAGDDYYVVGVYAGGGSAYANFLRENFDLSAPEEGSIEWQMSRLSGAETEAARFLDFRAVEGPHWKDEPSSGMNWGRFPIPMIPANQYDGILFFDAVTPTTYPAAPEPG